MCCSARSCADRLLKDSRLRRWAVVVCTCGKPISKRSQGNDRSKISLDMLMMKSAAQAVTGTHDGGQRGKAAGCWTRNAAHRRHDVVALVPTQICSYYGATAGACPCAEEHQRAHHAARTAHLPPVQVFSTSEMVRLVARLLRSALCAAVPRLKHRHASISWPRTTTCDWPLTIVSVDRSLQAPETPEGRSSTSLACSRLLPEAAPTAGCSTRRGNSTFCPVLGPGDGL